MIFAVIDTNVLVSALLAKSEKSTILQLINAILQNKVTTLYNEEITKEYFEVLSRSKFKFNPELKDELLASIQRHGIDSSRIPYDSPMPDESDRVFYEVALSKDDAYLVTGNSKHFPTTPIVVTPAEMLEIIRQEDKASH